MSLSNSDKEALEFHAKAEGKVRMELTQAIRTRKDLALTYTPGVAAASAAVAEHPEEVWRLTGRGRRIAIVTDGSAVLGLGDIGPEAALPVMEGKAALIKEFADIDAFPLCLSERDPEKFVAAVRALEPSVAGILLEDIAAPRCFLIEDALKEHMNIPVMHDDQHGTAVVVLAGLMNALKVRGSGWDSGSDTSLRHAEQPDSFVSSRVAQAPKGRSAYRGTKHVAPQGVAIVLSGAGAAGTAIARILLSQGFSNIVVCDRKGIISRKRSDLDAFKGFLAAATNPENLEGNLTDAMKGADIFIGVSAPNLVTEDMVRSMQKDPIIFALANPDPEIHPEVAKKAGAIVVATGRSDFPNQVNNLLAFPGIFRGALDARAKKITEAMKLAAANALASYLAKPTTEQILPDPLDRGVVKTIAEATRKRWI